MRLEEKVAQLFVVGSDDANLQEAMEPFVPVGLGGVLLFRHHLQAFDEAPDVKQWISELHAQMRGAGLRWVSLDQEGAQVERLPFWLFPTGIHPVSYGLTGNTALCEQVVNETARRLRWLGFNLNNTPTVDLNTEPRNPIIGSRSFGTDPERVVTFARLVMKAHLEAGVLPVLKHFPGHGSGSVDSHHELPVFDAWQPEELTPYAQLIQTMDVPAIMVAHGLYPQLFKQWQAPSDIPASLSNVIINQLLRQSMRFDGLVMTDDLMMNAIQEHWDPEEVAIKAYDAGMDMLVYRRAQPEAWLGYQALLHRFKQGKLDEADLDRRLERQLYWHQHMQQQPIYDYPELSWQPEVCIEQARIWSEQAITSLLHQIPSPLPLDQHSQWVLIAPDRSTSVHYAPDSRRSAELVDVFREYGMFPKAHMIYPVGLQPAVDLLPLSDVPADTIVFVAFNAILSPYQQALYRQCQHHWPEAKCVILSVGHPNDVDVLPNAWVHWHLPSFRPSAMQALVQTLNQSRPSLQQATI